MSAIEFRTLGTLDLRAADGRELHSLLAQPKRIALLAYLCMAEPRGYHRRDTLLGLFWPDSDQEHARTSLRKSLHILRRALGEDAILSRGDEDVAVDSSLIVCDAVSFDEMVGARRFQDALGLYHGDLLTGFFVDDVPEFEHWLASERARRRTEAASAALVVSEKLEDLRDLAGALVSARRGLELAGTDERALRKVLQLLVQTGDRATAIATYEAFARSLATDYGTQPSAETRYLSEQIHSGTEFNSAPGGDPPEAQSDHFKTAAADRTTSDAAAPGNRRSGRRRERALFVAAVIALVASAGFIWGLVRPRSAGQVVRYALVVDSSETMAPGDSWWSRIAISPDGSMFAYIGGQHSEVLLRPRNQLKATAVPGSTRAETPFFSPDGKYVGFLGEQRVYVAPVDGSAPPVMVCDTLSGVAGASWGPDNLIYVDGRGYQPLLRVAPRAGAAPAWFTSFNGDSTYPGDVNRANAEVDHTWPDVLPNGKGVLFGVTFANAGGVRDSLSYAIAVAEIPSGTHRVIVKDAVFARYAASGHLLYITTSKHLMVAPFDQDLMKITGEAKVLMDSMRVGRFGSADLAVSTTGTLIYATGGGPARRELVWTARDGTTRQVDPDWVGDFWGPALSPDGKRLAIARRLNTARVDIWIKELDRGPATRLTLDGTDGIHPAWTPDGKWVTYTDDNADSTILRRTRADGIGKRAPQFRAQQVMSEVWSPDGAWLLYGTYFGGAGSGDIDAFRPGIDTVPIPLIATKAREATPAFSADGHWLAYASNESGRFEIYVSPFPNVGDGRWLISAHGGIDPEWSRGNELFYGDSAGNLMVAQITTKPTLTVGRVKPLFSTDGFQFALSHKNYAVSGDDSRFLMIRRAREADEKIVVVENWFEEMKSRKLEQK